MAMTLEKRKKTLILRSDLLRRSLALQLAPVQRYADLASTGYHLVRTLRELMSNGDK